MRESSSESLLEQAGYLLAEIDSLLPLITRLPDEVLEARLPPTGRSVKEFYGAMIEMMDRHAVPAISEGSDAGFDVLDPVKIKLDTDWNDLAIDDILLELRQRRVSMLDRLSEDPSPQDVDVLKRVVRFDLECQRCVGERLFDVQPARSAKSDAQEP